MYSGYLSDNSVVQILSKSCLWEQIFMEDCLKDMLFIYSLEMINFTRGSTHPLWELHIWMASFWLLSNLLDRSELCCSDIGPHWRMLQTQPGKLCSGIYCWAGVQDGFLWTKKCFLYEDPREKFFLGRQDENVKQLVCLYLVDDLDLLTERISLLTSVCRKHWAPSVAHL